MLSSSADNYLDLSALSVRQKTRNVPRFIYSWSFMTGPTIATFKAQLNLSANNTNKDKSTITAYVRVVNHLLNWYGSDSIIIKAVEEIQNFKQCTLTPWNFSQKYPTWHLVAQTYTMKTLRGFLSKMLELLSAVKYAIDGWTTAKPPQKTSIIKTNHSWIYKADTRKPLLKMKHGFTL